MSASATSPAARLRARLSHPVIDGDGHWVEFGPVISPELRRIGGERAVEGLRLGGRRVRGSLALTVEERKRRGIAQDAFWPMPTRNTLDRATAMLPRLLHERLDELGIDFAVLYPTSGLALPRIADAEIRRITCRAFNTFLAEHFQRFSQRMTPAAVIPMHTPEEAVEELEHVKRALGLKAVMLFGGIQRPLPEPSRDSEEAVLRESHLAERLDVLALDSDHDYDPVWRACVELGFSPTFHRGSRGFGTRISPSNFCYNHIGHFAAASEAICKAVFLGGVTRRFPELRFAFLEGGVGWACQLYADLVGHWKIRNRAALEEVNPANLDPQLLRELAARYGDERYVRALEQGRGIDTQGGPQSVGQIADLDDYAACRIERPEDLRALFAERFYFGCEAEDRMTAWAFNRRVNPLGARLNPLFGSDVGHFDVSDMSAVLPEAHELVEEGLISESDFRDFTFANAVRLWGTTNPDFFSGTVVEKAASELLASEK
jgi:predicted TIM-barrel fold metal-dependent hydrolase